MVDECWFGTAQLERASVESTAEIPAIPSARRKYRADGVAECPDNTSCAACGRPLHEGMLVRPAHDQREVPYDCLTCWWQIEMDRVKKLAKARMLARAVGR